MPSANPPLDDDSDSPDADSCPMPTPSGGCTPSYADSCVMQGLPREEKHKEIIIEKSWEGKDCTDGVWEHATRGHGVTDEDDEQDADHVPAANGPPGHFGVFAGNWGGKWKERKEDDYMNDDIWNSPCQLILMQEVEPLFWAKMTRRQEADAAARRADGAICNEKALFVGVRGDEGHGRDSLLIAGRPGIVLGIRLKLFHKTEDGPYKESKKEKVAVSRIMVADFKMKNFRIRGSGEILSDILTVANVHMHCRTAKKETKDPQATTKRFWDLLASYLLRYGVRLMAGDFNMSFLCVVAEMRARGFQINLAAWYPFYMTHQKEMMVDSCGVFVIGPWRGVRLNYDCSLFKIVAPVRTPNNSMVMEVIRDEHGKEINRKPYDLHEYLIIKRDQVQGYPLSSYLPKNDAKEEHVRWTFDCVQDDQSAVAEQWAATERKPCWYPEANFDFAAESWDWPEMAPCSQKLVDYKKFDPDKTYFARGAHMPLMVFIGDKSKQGGPQRHEPVAV